MEITPRELRDVEIRAEMRGYNRDDVNDLLERAAATIEAANDRLQQLNDRVSSMQSEQGRTRETEDVLHRTLLLAQRAADEAVAEATAKSRQMLDDAEMQSRRLVADAEAEARRKGETERRRLEEEIVELAGRRDSLLADVEALTRFEAEYRERMVRALEADLFALRSRPTTAPGNRPETSDVEMPTPKPAEAKAEDAPQPQPQPQAQPQQQPAAKPPLATAPPTGLPPAPPVPPRIDTPRPAAAPPVGPTPTPTPTPAPPNAPAGGPPTREVDVRTLFEQPAPPPKPPVSEPKPAMIVDDDAPAKPAPGPAIDQPVVRPTPVAAPGPIDLLGNDGADADVLDDDAFFATLRDAVHDDAPLGPRDDDDPTGDNRFFDQDADRGGFRDVFRRRGR
jgi:DivIVA domain-containing protein